MAARSAATSVSADVALGGTLDERGRVVERAVGVVGQGQRPGPVHERVHVGERGAQLVGHGLDLGEAAGRHVGPQLGGEDAPGPDVLDAVEQAAEDAEGRRARRRPRCPSARPR